MHSVCGCARVLAVTGPQSLLQCDSAVFLVTQVCASTHSPLVSMATNTTCTRITVNKSRMMATLDLLRLAQQEAEEIQNVGELA